MKRPRPGERPARESHPRPLSPWRDFRTKREVKGCVISYPENVHVLRCVQSTSESVQRTLPTKHLARELRVCVYTYTRINTTGFKRRYRAFNRALLSVPVVFPVVRKEQNKNRKQRHQKPQSVRFGYPVVAVPASRPVVGSGAASNAFQTAVCRVVHCAIKTLITLFHVAQSWCCRNCGRTGRAAAHHRLPFHGIDISLC